MQQPVVSIIMGSRSDWPTLKLAAQVLDELKVPYETQVVSAHRTPDLLFEYAIQIIVDQMIDLFDRERVGRVGHIRSPFAESIGIFPVFLHLV